jgi:oligopeptidase B
LEKSDTYIPFSETAYVADVAYNPEFNTGKLRFSYQSMKTPPSTFEFDMKSGEKTLLKQQEIIGGYNPDDYVTERLWATSKDGVKVPLSIVYKKGL